MHVPRPRASSRQIKHIWAIDYVREARQAPDGSQIVTETMRVSYSQNWPNTMPTNATRLSCSVLLASLCEGILNPVKRGRGRPRHALAEHRLRRTGSR